MQVCFGTGYLEFVPHLRLHLFLYCMHCRYLHSAFSGSCWRCRSKGFLICRACSKFGLTCEGAFRLVGKASQGHERANPDGDSKGFTLLLTPHAFPDSRPHLLCSIHGILYPDTRLLRSCCSHCQLSSPFLWESQWQSFCHSCFDLGGTNCYKDKEPNLKFSRKTAIFQKQCFIGKNTTFGKIYHNLCC